MSIPDILFPEHMSPKRRRERERQEKRSNIGSCDLALFDQLQQCFDVCWRSPDGTALLIQGDAVDVMERIPDGWAQMVFTDPPYGNNNNDGDLIANCEKAVPNRRSREHKRLDLEEDAAPRPILADDAVTADWLVKMLFKEAARFLATTGCCCCCCPGGGGRSPVYALWSIWMDAQMALKQAVVWDKGPMGIGWHYRRSYEFVLVGEAKKGAAPWYGDRETENIIRPGMYGIKKIKPREDQHPTEKPVELAAHFIFLHTLQGEAVVDPFAGSGSTGEAAARGKRAFLGVEKDPVFFEMAKKRLVAVHRGLFY